METVVFIGLGNMGSGMAGNIQKADYPMVVYDLRHESTRPFVDRGARYAASPAEVARQCEVTFTSLPNHLARRFMDELGRRSPQQKFPRVVENSKRDILVKYATLIEMPLERA